MPQGSPFGGIVIEYPLEGSIFPPEITAPAFEWRDTTANVGGWRVEIEFGDGSAPLHVRTAGVPIPVEIDRRAVSETNALPAPDPALHTWKPDPATWASIKRHSVQRPAAITIRGEGSTGHVTISTSRDPAGAPIFYRDVPLMPSEAKKGVIKPLANAAIPLIAWRLRDLGEPQSRLVLEGIYSCANCHSFSRDGKTLGMDVDGPENDKGAYAIAPVAPRMSIRSQNVITWNSFPGKPAGASTIGFLSQVSPDGQYVVTTVNEEVYVANFKDYRFLQVFYPTRGILAWYNRATREMKALPGANDPRYVHTDAVWSPDGRYLVFARAAAKDAYPPGRPPAAFANDAAETPIQYDLYRIPFNGGRGGVPQPIAGASQNGMSNTFPRVSPDGRWIVFVKCRNGQLMRPDSELHIVPAEGGAARRMRANTRLMNSWHSFSPNGRWMVFASKSRSPYTQMFLTHLDEDGRDSPPVLIENATAGNRAANLPEFVNIAPKGLLKIEVPAAEFYRVFDTALELQQSGRYAGAVSEWKRALDLDPVSPKARTNFGIALWGSGARDEAMVQFRRAVELNPRYAEAHNNLGVALVELGRFEEAVTRFRTVLRLNPDSGEARSNLAVALMQAGNARYVRGNGAEALAIWREVIGLAPDRFEALNQAAWVLATSPDATLRNGALAHDLAERALVLSRGEEPAVFDTLAAAKAELGSYSQAVETVRKGLALASFQKNFRLAEELRARLKVYESGQAFRAGRAR